MDTIELKISKSCIIRQDKNIILSGQVGLTKLLCEFVEGDWADMDKYALFTVPGIDKPFKEKLVNGACDVPPEALAAEWPIIVGVYGEFKKDDKVMRRYSPAPIPVIIRRGSYMSDTQEASAVVICEWFAKQAADANKAAQNAIRAAQIANDILQQVKEVHNESKL